MTNEIEAQAGGSMTIPKWFLYVVSSFFAMFTVTFIPWAGWVTMTLATLSVKIENTDELRKRQDRLETSITEHVTHPGIHGALTSRVDRLESRIEQIEKRN